MLRLPEALEDYIAPGTPVRFIDAFVGQLDLGQAGFRHGGSTLPPTQLIPTYHTSSRLVKPRQFCHRGPQVSSSSAAHRAARLIRQQTSDKDE